MRNDKQIEIISVKRKSVKRLQMQNQTKQYKNTIKHNHHIEQYRPEFRVALEARMKATTEQNGISSYNNDEMK